MILVRLSMMVYNRSFR